MFVLLLPLLQLCLQVPYARLKGIEHFHNPLLLRERRDGNEKTRNIFSMYMWDTSTFLGFKDLLLVHFEPLKDILMQKKI